MADNEVPPKANEAEYDAGHVPITEELDSAKRNLPPAVPVVIALVVVGIVVGIIAFMERAKPIAQGGIDEVYFSQPRRHEQHYGRVAGDASQRWR